MGPPIDPRDEPRRRGNSYGEAPAADHYGPAGRRGGSDGGYSDSDGYRKDRGYSSVNDNTERKRQRDYDREEHDYYKSGRRDSRDRRYRADSLVEDNYNAPSRKNSGGGDDYHYGHAQRDHVEAVVRSRARSKAAISDWKCEKCFVWNYPDENRCAGCSSDRPTNEDDDDQDDGRRHHRSRSHSSSSSNDNNDDKSVDEFGRKTKKKKDGNEDEWPPSFQDSSEDFVLDARSGMFYHKEADFFYDPTSKLYYGNKKRAYFSYNADKDTFLPVESSSGDDSKLPPAGSSGATDAMDQDQLMLVPNGANNTTANNKAVIAIKIKTKLPKKRKKRWDAGTDAAVKDTTNTKKAPPGDIVSKEPTSKLQKEHAKSLERWSGRKEEMDSHLKDENHHGTGANSIKTKPRFTKDGKPICWLCKRKFESLEKLQLHEDLSTMHKENLSKENEKREAAAKRSAEERARYIDRAQQRRDLYGPEMTLPDALPVNDSTSLPLAEEPSGESGANVGQQMLQKLGWKEGSMLGRGSDQQKDQRAALAEDWNRIESLATKNKYSGGRAHRS